MIQIQSPNPKIQPTTNTKIQEQVDVFKKFNEQNFVRLTRNLYRQVTVNINKRLEICGYNDIAARHLSVFDHLDFEGTNIVTLANRANISKQAMSKLVKEASAAGYVSTRINETDSRILMVNFTDKGLLFLKRLQTEINKAREVILKTAFVSHDEVSTTISTLSKILGYFDNTESTVMVGKA